MPVSPFDTGFGVEIECYMPEGATHAQVTAAVKQRIGRPVHPQGYNHQRSTDWKAVPDGSLNDYTRGVELVSPVLHGDAGIAEVEKVIKALADFGCTVSKKCGFHVHVGIGTADMYEAGENVNQPPLSFLKRLVNIYATFEPVIDSVMPPSRRANTNTYCKSLTSASPAAINAATTFDQVSRLAANNLSADARRFFKLNLMAWVRYKTVEFRHHAGTLEATKVRFWILTCLRMVAAARNGATINIGQASAAPTSSPVNRARQGSKSWTVGQMMLRPEGVTGPEACAAVGWPSISMPQQAAICGLTFTTQRIGRTVRYFARTAQAEVAAVPTGPAPTSISLLGFVDLIGADINEREYLFQRQADLGGPISWAA